MESMACGPYVACRWVGRTGSTEPVLMARTQCWDCGEVSRMLPLPGSGGRMDDEFSRYATFRCGGRGALSVGFFEPDHEGVWPDGHPVGPATGHSAAEAFEDVPVSVADGAAEAVLCMQAGPAPCVQAAPGGRWQDRPESHSGIFSGWTSIVSRDKLVTHRLTGANSQARDDKEHNEPASG